MGDSNPSKSHTCDSDVTYEYTCRNTDGSFSCDVNIAAILPTIDTTTGKPDDGFETWSDCTSYGIFTHDPRIEQIFDRYLSDKIPFQVVLRSISW